MPFYLAARQKMINQQQIPFVAENYDRIVKVIFETSQSMRSSLSSPQAGPCGA